MIPIPTRIAQEINARPTQVQAAIELLDQGASVPFIARYRKEVTDGLDDTQLRTLETRLVYLRELEARRVVILNSVREQGKLSPELQSALEQADSKTALEDLYLPYKPKRRTKAQIAREQGLAPLAEQLLQQPTLDPQSVAAQFLNPDAGVTDAKTALDGARQILMEQFAEDAPLLGKLRQYVWETGLLCAKVIAGQEDAGAKFADYFDFAEPIHKLPAHRALALFRGFQEGVLELKITLGAQDDSSVCESQIAQRFGISAQGRAADQWLLETVRWTWKVKLAPHLDVESKQQRREAAEEESIRVFASNLKDLLLAAPAGAKTILGLDPGLRTGVKVALVDATGKLLATETIYPHAPHNRWQEALATLGRLCAQHQVQLLSIGNGTASRETDRLATELISRYPDLKLQKLVVSEAGASVYSASELAAQEFPELDVSLRGAVSIARRLQDPLAELVKIDPKAIGVGQYQHDVNQAQLARTLDAVVEDCVNAVGVDVNTASVPLLARVSGLNQSLARNIVAYRDQNGPFSERKQLLKVPRLGEKTFEQAAGFLRIARGANPLDCSAVHPEAYPVVERILAKTGKRIEQLLGDSALLRTLDPAQFTDQRFGIPTVRDILAELEKPGRDPRPEFKTASFADGVEKIEDLRPGMILEGVVSNVANFGAFVDIGVHQDGLVHISALSDKFIKDPREVVKAGQVVKVKVLEVDVKRKRIGLTMKLADDHRDHVSNTKPERQKPTKAQAAAVAKPSTGSSALAEAFKRARKD